MVSKVKELLQETRDRFLGVNVPWAELTGNARSTYGVFMLMYFILLFGLLFYTLDPDSLEMLMATMLTFDGLSYLVILVVSTWTTFFVVELIFRMFGVYFTLVQRLVAQSVTSLGVIVCLLFVFDLNFISFHVESKAIDFIEEEFGQVSSVSFKKVKQNTFEGVVRLKEPKEENGIYYILRVEPYKVSSRSYKYTMDLKYDLVNIP